MSFQGFINGFISLCYATPLGISSVQLTLIAVIKWRNKLEIESNGEESFAALGLRQAQ